MQSINGLIFCTSSYCCRFHYSHWSASYHQHNLQSLARSLALDAGQGRGALSELCAESLELE